MRVKMRMRVRVRMTGGEWEWGVGMVAKNKNLLFRISSPFPWHLPSLTPPMCMDRKRGKPLSSDNAIV